MAVNQATDKWSIAIARRASVSRCRHRPGRAIAAPQTHKCHAQWRLCTLRSGSATSFVLLNSPSMCLLLSLSVLVLDQHILATSFSCPLPASSGAGRSEHKACRNVDCILPAQGGGKPPKGRRSWSASSARAGAFFARTAAKSRSRRALVTGHVGRGSVIQDVHVGKRVVALVGVKLELRHCRAPVVYPRSAIVAGRPSKSQFVAPRALEIHSVCIGFAKTRGIEFEAFRPRIREKARIAAGFFVYQPPKPNDILGPPYPYPPPP